MNFLKLSSIVMISNIIIFGILKKIIKEPIDENDLTIETSGSVNYDITIDDDDDDEIN